MTDILSVGIDTSNYKTSAAIVMGGKVVYNGCFFLPVKEGERGLRQSDAVFAHVKQLPKIMDKIGELLLNYEKHPDAVGVSRSPRDVEGSYMPCFLAGEVAAHSFAAAANVPIYEFSHQAGHIAAALYSAGKTELLFGDKPFAAFHVSGGTTEVTLVTPSKRTAEIEFITPDGNIPTDIAPTIECIGGTNDLNAGQLIDRVGVMMGMRFPCGRELEETANLYDGEPIPVSVSVKGLECNLSGAENKARQLYEKTGDKAKAAAFTLDFVADTIDTLTKNLRREYKDIPVIYAGGVMSCMRMRAKLGKRRDVYFSDPEFSADNAAGTALLAYFAQKKRREQLKGYLEQHSNTKE